MVTERSFSKGRYFLAFLITTCIFVIGLLLGSYITSAKLSSLQSLEQDLRTQLASYDIQSLLVSENPCQFTDVDQLVTELGSLANRLTSMEDQLGKDNAQVIQLKRYYSLLEVRHWLFLKKLNEKCAKKQILVLYFYSGDTQACTSCESQGYLLSYLRNKYPQVRVYSFDVRIEDPSLYALKSIYSVKEVPTIVFDDTPYTRYLNRDELDLLVQKRLEAT